MLILAPFGTRTANSVIFTPRDVRTPAYRTRGKGDMSFGPEVVCLGATSTLENPVPTPPLLSVTCRLAVLLPEAPYAMPAVLPTPSSKAPSPSRSQTADAIPSPGSGSVEVE